MSKYGYIRVSTKEQNEDRQFLAMRDLAIPEKNLIVEKQSGKDFDRPKYRKLVRRLKKEDVFYIKSIDRLDRQRISAEEAASRPGMSRATFYRRVK